MGICGSPRKRNTWFMLETVMGAANKKGAETELISLIDYDISQCMGCLSCEETGKCVIKDDMKKILTKVKEADALVLGSPSYYNNVTGLMKCFIDRTNPTWKKMELKGKKMAICCTGSQDVEVVECCTGVLIDYADTMGMKIAGSVTAKDSKIHSKDVVDELKKLGEKIASD